MSIQRLGDLQHSECSDHDLHCVELALVRVLPGVGVKEVCKITIKVQFDLNKWLSCLINFDWNTKFYQILNYAQNSVFTLIRQNQQQLEQRADIVGGSDPFEYCGCLGRLNTDRGENFDAAQQIV